MRLGRPPGWRLFHFCGWDRGCRGVHTPWYLYLHFLKREDGRLVRLDLSPPWVRRANARRDAATVQRWLWGKDS